MLVTLVIRLRPEKLAVGEFVGEIEHVGDGSHELFRDLGELLAFARRAAPTDRDDPAVGESVLER